VVRVIFGEQAGAAAEVEDIFAGKGIIELNKEGVAKDVWQVIFGIDSGVGDGERVIVSGNVKRGGIDVILWFFHK